MRGCTIDFCRQGRKIDAASNAQQGIPQLIPFLLVQIRCKQIGFDRALSCFHPAYSQPIQ
jgi:hypothetical protein